MQASTRIRILDYLRKNRAATANEISHGLGMTGANIRYHLAILEADELIVVIEKRNEERGRPANVYGLTNPVLGSGLVELAEAVIDAWLGNLEKELQDEALRSLAERLSGKGIADPTIAVPRRIAQTVDRLTKLHYQARWEAGANGARIILGHCPYAEIILRHPELCRMDAHLLERQLALQVKQVAKLERGAAGVPECIFAVK